MMSVSKSRVVKLRSSTNEILEVEEAICGSAVGTDKIPSRRHRCQPCDTIARGQFQNPSHDDKSGRRLSIMLLIMVLLKAQQAHNN